MADELHEDLPRAAKPSEPPVPGAQWDEVHQRWEHWDEAAGGWVVVGDASGAVIRPEAENPYPASLARELLRADDADDEDAPVPDLPRIPEPDERRPGAQWNELNGHWERWDETAEAWVEDVGDPDE